jgi:hypothetical protein
MKAEGRKGSIDSLPFSLHPSAFIPHHCFYTVCPVHPCEFALFSQENFVYHLAFIAQGLC